MTDTIVLDATVALAIAAAAEDRDVTIRSLREFLKRRSGKTWSVTGGRGTAWGWIRIDVLPRVREHGARAAGRDELAALLGLPDKHAYGGVSVPASRAHRREYLERAAGRPVTAIAEPYWD